MLVCAQLRSCPHVSRFSSTPSRPWRDYQNSQPVSSMGKAPMPHDAPKLSCTTQTTMPGVRCTAAPIEGQAEALLNVPRKPPYIRQRFSRGCYGAAESVAPKGRVRCLSVPCHSSPASLSRIPAANQLAFAALRIRSTGLAHVSGISGESTSSMVKSPLESSGTPVRFE